MQTLDAFFKVTSKYKRFFYLDWTQQPYTVQWLTSRPNRVNFESNVQWRDLGLTVIICGYSLEPALANYLRLSSPGSISFLKSHLQKCIRRQLTQKAIATAWMMIQSDLNEFIRRLPIIMLEDVTLCEEFSVLVWLMVAISKNYRPTYGQIQWLLNLVSGLCQLNEVAEIDDSHTETQMSIKTVIKDIDCDPLLSDTQRDLIYCLGLRIAYGGMQGDMNMLLQFAKWSQRQICPILPKAIQSPSSPPPVDFNLHTLIPVKLEEIEISAADFHCFPQMLNDLGELYPQYTKDELKKCIWECSSKFNSRKNEAIEDQWQEIWTKIGDDVYEWQQAKVNSFTFIEGI